MHINSSDQALQQNFLKRGLYFSLVKTDADNFFVENTIDVGQYPHSEYRCRIR
jgi:hypothetical protein